MKSCQISCSIWEDDNFLAKTPEFKFFWLYMLTNRHIDICGVIHIADVTISKETGFSLDAVKGFKIAFKEMTKQIDYDDSTNEILILEWYKANWTNSPKFKEGLLSAMQGIASKTLLEAIKSDYGIFYGEETNIATEAKEINREPYKCFGRFNRIRLKQTEYDKLKSEYGKSYIDELINLLDEYVEENNNKNHYTNFNLVIRKAIRDNWSIIRKIKSPISPENKEKDLSNVITGFKQF